MHQHLDKPIKPLLETHPALVQVLDGAGIGCSQCGLGTCKVADILEIHDLSPEASRTLFTRMGEVIYAGQPFEIPLIDRQVQPKKAGFCPPIATMVREHTHILALISHLPALIQALATDWEDALPLLEGALNFIRTYADRYHHAKEEDILFGFFSAHPDILGVMLEDHAQGRTHVQAVGAAIQNRDLGRIEAELLAYGQLLRGHIHREDTILYPWMDRCLDTRQVGALFSRCAEVEREFGLLPRQQERFVAELAKRLA